MSQPKWKQRLLSNHAALASLFIITAAALLAIFGYFVAPDSSENANNIIPEIALQSPGYKQNFLLLQKQSISCSFWNRLARGCPLLQQWIPIQSISFAGKKAVATVFAGTGLPAENKTFDLREIVFGDTLKNWNQCDSVELKKEIVQQHIVTKRFWLGTDMFGRDVLSRLIIGLRISMAVGTMAVIIALIVGLLLGTCAGYFEGKTDAIIMWFINVIWAIPTILLIFGTTLILGKGIWQIFVAIGLTTWVSLARIIRGQVKTIKENAFIEAAHSMGFSNARIILRHIIPNVIAPSMIVAASNFATAILLEAGLSFLGIGVQPPVPSWGNMIRDNYGFIVTSHPLLALAPGFAIMILVLAFNLLSNSLRDALDVKEN